MYELKNGSERLINALQTADIKTLSKILNYVPEQLKEDITAIEDYYKLHERIAK